MTRQPCFRVNVSRLRELPGYESIEPTRDFVVLYPATVRHPRDSSVMFFKTPPVAHVDVLADSRTVCC